MLQLSYNCEGRAFLRTESTKWYIDLMVGISAAILDHEVTWGRKTIEDAWAPAPMDHHCSFGLFLIFLKVRSKFLIFKALFLFVCLLFTTELDPNILFESESDFPVFFACSFFFKQSII